MALRTASRFRSLQNETIVQLNTRNACLVDLPLDPATLNERLMNISIWLADRQMPHRVLVLFLPEQDCVRIRFPRESDARAFRARFGYRIH